MNPTTPQALLDCLTWRYATQKFDQKKKIPAEIWQVLEQSLVLSPSSYGLQPWKFVMVGDSELRKRLREASWNQPQIEEASHLVVLCAKKTVGTVEIDKLIDCICGIRDIPASLLTEYRAALLGALVPPPPQMNMELWTSKQCYLALGFFLCSAAILGVDTCPIEGFEQEKYNQILELEQQGYHAAVVVAAGYRALDDSSAGQKKVRFKLEELIEQK